MSPIELAAVLAAVVLVASMISVELGVTVALIELTLGVVVGNVFHLDTAEWLDFIAKFASIVLTFLAGMEVDPAYMRRRLPASLGIGVASFAGPFVIASLVSYFVLDWTLKASLIAGTALSTTSLAVVYAVLVERDLTTTCAERPQTRCTTSRATRSRAAAFAPFRHPNDTRLPEPEHGPSRSGDAAGRGSVALKRCQLAAQFTITGVMSSRRSAGPGSRPPR
jgi:hypothetical protein